MKNLYLDSNIWLSLYHFSHDDLEQFMKLKKQLGKTIKLFIPMQTHDEVYRNRDAKILDSLKKFKELSLNFPTFTKSYPEYKSFTQHFLELKNAHRDWLTKIENDIRDLSLPADRAINDFFTADALFACDKEIVDAGKQRYDIGNPPGKDGKYGDAINWECLLRIIPNGEDLYFISNDKDYASPINENQFNLFLRNEWMQKKQSRIVFYKSLDGFLKEHMKDITLQADQEKDELITELLFSGSFRKTHSVVNQLAEYTEWSEGQLDDLLRAALDNNQVGWIIGDDDVYEFYSNLMSCLNQKDPVVQKLAEILKEAAESKNS